MSDRATLALAAAVVIAMLVFWGSVIYVGVHFITKFW
jgi:hypothetical protein